MHIGIDLGLRLQNSNQFNKLQKEEKDFVLNKAILSIVKDSIPTEPNQANVLDDDAIKEQYNILDSILLEKEYTEFDSGDKYIEVTLPVHSENYIQSGVLYAGNKYKIFTVGTTDLTAFNCPTPSPDKEFVYAPANVMFTYAGMFSIMLQEGYIYKIKRVDGFDFTAFGARANEVGITFVCTNTNFVSSPILRNTELEVIAGLPIWDGKTILRNIKNLSVFELIRSTSLVHTGCTFTKGALRKGYYYRVENGGTIIDMRGFGAISATLEKGYIFLCIRDGVPQWSGTTKLSELMLSVNRLPALKDVDNSIAHPVGTLASSPISTRLSGKLRIYHDNKFDIHRVNITYIRKPISVDSITGINCDLNEAIHDSIVDKAVSYVAAISGAPTYQLLKNEENQNK